MKSGLLFMVFCLWACCTIAQSKTIDSLWRVYNNTKADSAKIELLIESIGYELEGINPDSALGIYRKGLSMAQNSNYTSAEARAYMYIAIMKMYLGDFDSSIHFFLKSEEQFEIMSRSPNPLIATKGLKGVATIYNNISNVYNSRAQYPQAIEYLQKAAQIFESMGDKSRIAACYINIGSIHIHLKNPDLALKYLSDANELVESISLEKANDIQYQIQIIDVNVNLGIVHFDRKDLEKAQTHFAKALAVAKAIDYRPKMAACLNNLGNVALEKGNLKEAIDYYSQGLKIREELGDMRGVALTKTNLAKLLFLLSIKEGKPMNQKNELIARAIELASQAYNTSKELKSFQIENESAARLMEIYGSIGMYKKALEFSSIYISTKDSMFAEEKTKALVEMETRYQTEKKQQEIEKQQLVIDKQRTEVRRQKLQRNFFIVGSMLLVLLVLVVYRSYRQKKQSNEIISQKNILLEQANEEIAAQRDLVVEQKEHIELIHGELTSSIRYASRIQAAVLPSPEQMDNLLGEHFILFRPKDIVSGDFYWATGVANQLVFCVADCTGHGVPGSFMSMLGVSYLNEIVHKEGVTVASQILNRLRSCIIDALKQKGEGSEQKDGMDIGLCVLNLSSKQMQFAGGYNPCWIIPSKEHTAERLVSRSEETDEPYNSEILQFKPDKMPIAIHKHMEPYTNHILQLYPGDQVYLMSDGFQDQFGGTQGKKFMGKNLRELIFTHSHLPLTEQKIVLNNTLNNWMGQIEQVDDVTIMGVKID